MGRDRDAASGCRRQRWWALLLVLVTAHGGCKDQEVEDALPHYHAYLRQRAHRLARLKRRLRLRGRLYLRCPEGKRAAYARGISDVNAESPGMPRLRVTIVRGAKEDRVRVACDSGVKTELPYFALVIPMAAPTRWDWVAARLQGECARLRQAREKDFRQRLAAALERRRKAGKGGAVLGPLEIKGKVGRFEVRARCRRAGYAAKADLRPGGAALPLSEAALTRMADRALSSLARCKPAVAAARRVKRRLRVRRRAPRRNKPPAPPPPPRAHACPLCANTSKTACQLPIVAEICERGCDLTAGMKVDEYCLNSVGVDKKMYPAGSRFKCETESVDRVSCKKLCRLGCKVSLEDGFPFSLAVQSWSLRRALLAGKDVPSSVKEYVRPWTSALLFCDNNKRRSRAGSDQQTAAEFVAAISTRKMHESSCRDVVWSDILHRKNVQLRCALGCKLAADQRAPTSGKCRKKVIVEACEFVCRNGAAAHFARQRPSSCRQACDQTKHRASLAYRCFAKQSTSSARDCRQDSDCKLVKRTCCRCGHVWRYAFNKTKPAPPCDPRSCSKCPPGKAVHLGSRVKCIKPELIRPGSVPDSRRTGQCTAYY